MNKSGRPQTILQVHRTVATKARIQLALVHALRPRPRGNRSKQPSNLQIFGPDHPSSCAAETHASKPLLLPPPDFSGAINSLDARVDFHPFPIALRASRRAAHNFAFKSPKCFAVALFFWVLATLKRVPDFFEACFFLFLFLFRVLFFFSLLSSPHKRMRPSCKCKSSTYQSKSESNKG